MKIQLDTNAMNALFPEGSESRVELQKAVIANFATRIRDEQLKSIVRDELRGVGFPEAELREEFRRIIRIHFTDQWGIPNLVVKEQSDIKAAIRTAVRDHANSIFRQLIDEEIKKVGEESDGIVKARVDKLRDELEKTVAGVDTRIRQRVVANIDEIIRIELANAMNRIKNGNSTVL